MIAFLAKREAGYVGNHRYARLKPAALEEVAVCRSHTFVQELSKRTSNATPARIPSYTDPPYWQTERYGVPFGIEQYKEIARFLTKLKGKAIISLNDHPDIRHTVCGGIVSDDKEVLILSWDVEAETAGLF